MFIRGRAAHRALGIQGPTESPPPSRACVGLPPQNHMLLEHKMERPSLKQMHLATACLASCKKELAPSAPNNCTGDANGHLQVEAPLMHTT